MWNYSPGGSMPTHHNLSPLRQCICNAKIKEAADIVLTFDSFNHSHQVVHFPNTWSDLEEEVSRMANTGANSNYNSLGKIKKMYSQEVRKIAKRDPLHDLTVQVCEILEWFVLLRIHCQELTRVFSHIIGKGSNLANSGILLNRSSWIISTCHRLRGLLQSKSGHSIGKAFGSLADFTCGKGIAIIRLCLPRWKRQKICSQMP